LLDLSKKLLPKVTARLRLSTWVARKVQLQLHCASKDLVPLAMATWRVKEAWL